LAPSIVLRVWGVARVERSETRVACASYWAVFPGFAEFTLGLAKGETRGLNLGYESSYALFFRSGLP